MEQTAKKLKIRLERDFRLCYEIKDDVGGLIAAKKKGDRYD